MRIFHHQVKGPCSDTGGDEKVFVKQVILSIMQEYAELWEHRLPKTEEK